LQNANFQRPPARPETEESSVGVTATSSGRRFLGEGIFNTPGSLEVIILWAAPAITAQLAGNILMARRDGM
jgi:hypothetical protein